MNKRKFLKQSALGAASLLVGPQLIGDKLYKPDFENGWPDYSSYGITKYGNSWLYRHDGVNVKFDSMHYSIIEFLQKEKCGRKFYDYLFSNPMINCASMYFDNFPASCGFRKTRAFDNAKKSLIN